LLAPEEVCRRAAPGRGTSSGPGSRSSATNAVRLGRAWAGEPGQQAATCCPGCAGRGAGESAVLPKHEQRFRPPRSVNLNPGDHGGMRPVLLPAHLVKQPAKTPELTGRGYGAVLLAASK